MLEHPRNICTLFFIVVGTYVALCYLYDLWILWTLIYRNVTTFVRNYRKSTSETWLKLYLFPPQTNISSKRWSFLNPEMILFFVISWFLFCLCETHTDFYFILFFFFGGGSKKTRFHGICEISMIAKMSNLWSPDLFDFSDSCSKQGRHN